MAIVSKTICDMCRADVDVFQLVVSYDRAARAPWEIDLCVSCYQDRLGELIQAGRPASVSNLRPQARVRKTTITPENL